MSQMRQLKVRTRIIGTIILLASISGCEKARYIELESDGGFLDAPSGKYLFRSISAEQGKLLDLSEPSRFYLMAESPKVKVIYCGACIQRNIFIASNQTDKSVNIAVKDARYTVEGIAYRVFSDHTIENGSTRSFERRLPGPDTKNAFWFIRITGPYFSDRDQKEERTHNLSVPFTIGSDRYTAHVIAIKRIRTKYELAFGVPATP